MCPGASEKGLAVQGLEPTNVGEPDQHFGEGQPHERPNQRPDERHDDRDRHELFAVRGANDGCRRRAADICASEYAAIPVK